MHRNTRRILAVLTLAAVVGVSPMGVSAAPGKGRVISRQSAGQVRAERQKTRPSKPEKHHRSGPIEVFSDIERGWKSGSVDLILRHFGGGKVSISVEGTGPSGGKFSKSQSYYLLKDLFKYTITKKFEFVQYRKPGEDGKSSFAVAERYYQKTDDGRLFKDKIYVSLHSDDGEYWVVSEIKSIR